jgi:hypothetical protein
MLTVVSHGSFKNGFDLLDEAGRTIGALTGSAWRESGRITDGQREYEFRKDGGRRWALAGPDGEPARAERTSFWSGKWRVDTGSGSYELAKPSMWTTEYELRAGGRLVGSVRRRGVFKSGAEAELPAELPAAVQVFVVAVVTTQWRRDSSAAAGGAAAGAAASS